MLHDMRIEKGTELRGTYAKVRRRFAMSPLGIQARGYSGSRHGCRFFAARGAAGKSRSLPILRGRLRVRSRGCYVIVHVIVSVAFTCPVANFHLSIKYHNLDHFLISYCNSTKSYRFPLKSAIMGTNI